MEKASLFKLDARIPLRRTTHATPLMQEPLNSVVRPPYSTESFSLLWGVPILCLFWFQSQPIYYCSEFSLAFDMANLICIQA
eukprot:2841311-Amphidinium_carterae.1